MFLFPGTELWHDDSERKCVDNPGPPSSSSSSSSSAAAAV